VLMTAQIHSDEMMGGEILFALMHLLADGYGNDERLTRLVDEREIWLIPCHNPDGLVFCEQQFNNGEQWLWRVNRRVHQDGRIGVDLNRNYGYMWGYDNIGSNPIWRGDRAFSEPESQAVREFVNDRDFSISLFFHAFGNYCLIPLHYFFIFTPDRGLLYSISERLTAQNNYGIGSCWEWGTRMNGGSEDWLYMSDEHNPIMAFLIEVGSRNDGHFPPRERVQPLIDENIELCLTAIEYSDNPHRALPPPSPDDVTVVANDNGNPEISWDAPEDESNPPTGFNVVARRLGDEFVDDVERENEDWDYLNVARNQGISHSGRFSYYFGNTLPKGYYLSLSQEIIAPDTLFAWLQYSLVYPFSLQVSLDGCNWVSLPGMGCNDFIVDGFNHGPGLRGQSRDWRRQWWTFGEYSGQMVKIRFRLPRLGNRAMDFCYLDDIGPLPFTEWSEIVAENVEESPFIDEDREPDPDVEYLVQSVDGEGDTSLLSLPCQISVPDTIRIPLEDGWSMISINVNPPQEFYRNGEERCPSV